MFAAYASPGNARQAFASTYRTMGVETGVAAASPHKLVQMLFDGYLDAVSRARGAMRQRDYAAKGRAIVHAVRIINEGLRAGLNLRDGGHLAADLHELYAYVTLRLTQANLNNDEAMLDECARLIQPLRDAWVAIAPDRL